MLVGLCDRQSEIFLICSAAEMAIEMRRALQTTWAVSV
jgi:hypothetical protein